MNISKISAALAVALTLLVTGCSTDSEPAPTKSVGEIAPKPPKEAVDYASNADFGISAAGPELKDQFGVFNQVTVDPASKVFTHTPEILAADVNTVFTPDQSAAALRASVNFTLSQYADSPLVWDDSPEAKAAFIESTLPFIDDYSVDAFKSAFDSTAATGYIIVDANDLSWRTEARNLKPSTYAPGSPRYALKSFEIKSIALYGEAQGIRFDYELSYEREVVDAEGNLFAEVTVASVAHSMNFSGPDGSVRLAGWESSATSTYEDRP